MMGYRYPDQDQVAEEGFSAQFEWEGQQLLFRRNRRDAPVQVRPEERDRAIDAYEPRLKHARIATAILTIPAILVIGIRDDTATLPNHALEFAIGIAVIILLELVKSRVARSATSAFDHRTPVGPPRTRIELRQAKVANQSYGTLALGGAAAALAFLAPWPPQSVSGWFAIAVTSAAAVMALVDIGLRLTRNRG